MKLKNGSGALMVLVFSIFDYVDGIQCYQCRSDIQPNCDKNRIDMYEYISECVGGSNKNPICREITQIVYFMNKNKRVVIRECAYVHNGQKCYQTMSADVYVETCDCDNDYCNGGIKILQNVYCILFLFLPSIVWALFPP